MSEELEHIDTIFSEKLKDHKEKPSAAAWDKLAKSLDEKGKDAHQFNKGKKGNMGLLTITVISFMFLFSGHKNLEIHEEVVTKTPVKVENNIPIRSSIIPETQKAEEVEKSKKPSFSSTEKKTNFVVPENKKSPQISKEEITTKLNNKVEQESIFENEIRINKKPIVNLRAPKKTSRKGIKVEITLAPSTQEESKGATSPQTKNTLNTIFRKLRKFSEASKKN